MTARLTKKETVTLRLVLSSAFGGAYSMIILADSLPEYVTVLTKIAAAVVIMLIAFRFYRVKSFLLTMLVFLSANFMLLGIVIGAYLLLQSQRITIHNGTVYFDIGARGLLLCAFFAYLLSCVIVRIYNRSVAKGEIYTLEIEHHHQTVTLFAFADTGNKLKEPFSDAPVIIAQREKLEPLLGDSKIRLIPASTINRQSFLVSFKPDKITLKSSGGKEVIENAYVALSDEIKNDSFSAVINPEILSV